MDGSTKKFPFLLVIAFLLVFGVALGYGYFFSQKNAVNDQIAEVDREIVEVRNQLDELRSSETVSAQRGVAALENIEATEVLWSDVLDILIKVIPLDLTERRPLVDFTSYSGAEGGLLTFNSRTNPSTNVKRQLDAISTIINTFNENPAFQNAFVPSISKSITEEEESVLSFIFNVEYLSSSESIETEAVPRR